MNSDFGALFRNHIIAMAIMALSGVAAIIAGIYQWVNVGWQSGLITFLVVSAVGSLVGFALALFNMYKASRELM